MAPMTTASGGCLCGGVQYEVHGPLRPVIYCHCEQCRRTSGNYVAASACGSDELILLSADTLSWFSSSTSADRGFCQRCGANLFWRPSSGTQVSIMTGTLDDTKDLVAIAHIYVKNAASFLSIDDGLPQHDEYGDLNANTVTD